MTTENETQRFTPVDAQTGQPLELAMQALWLTGKILPVGATLEVQHIFQCAAKKPIEVVYAFALPRDAALRRFRIVGKGFSVESDLKPVAEAQRIYEEGIERGSLSSLARQYRDGVINLNVGNIQPGETVAVQLELVAGVELRDDGLRFRFPFTLAPTYHAQARVIEAEPGVGETELPKDFGDVMLPKWLRDASGLHRVGFDLAVCVGRDILEIGSPSHGVRVRNEAVGCAMVSLASSGDLPDRDLVLDVRTAPTTTVVGGMDGQGRGQFAAIIPSVVFGTPATNEPRRVAFVVDRSGSMQGEPINQARAAVKACLATLSERDWFTIVAFDDQTETLSPQLRQATDRHRADATAFLDSVEARGGTNLVAGFAAAAGAIGTAGGDVFLLNDGQVAGTDEILAKARATGVRLHCLGIGSASQDRFLTLLARETAGISRFVTPRERVDLAAVDLFAGVSAPVAAEVAVSGQGDGVQIAPTPANCVHAGVPLVAYGETDSGATGLVVHWTAGGGRHEIKVPLALADGADGPAVRLIRGARLITDCEAHLPSAGRDGAAARRETARTEKALEKLSLQYGLACRTTALVAVVRRQGDRAGEIPTTTVVPVGMPQDTRFDSYFGATAGAVGTQGLVASPSHMMIARSRFAMKPAAAVTRIAEAAPAGPPDIGMELAGRLRPDGGLPGRDDDARWINTAVALLFFIEQGNTPISGTFRAHTRRLLEYLTAHLEPKSDHRKLRLIEWIKQGGEPRGNWKRICLPILRGDDVDQKEFWLQLDESLSGLKPQPSKTH